MAILSLNIMATDGAWGQKKNFLREKYDFFF
jgi:hypothetical protein